MNGLGAIAVLGSGNIVGTVISAISLILFSRFMGPTEFGLFSAAFAMMQIIVRLADVGTNMATERTIARVHNQDPQRADRLMRVAFWFKLACFMVCLSVAWILTPWISQSLLHISDPTLLRLATVLAGGTIFFEYVTVVFQSMHRFGMVARITIAQAIGKLVFGLLCIWQGMLHAASGLIIYGLLPGLGALVGWVRPPLSTWKLPATWKKDLSSILTVAKWTAIAAMAATLADNIDTLMVKSFMTSYDTGIWAGAVRIATFASLVGWTIGSVLNIRVARYSDKKHLQAYMHKAWKLAIAAALLVMLAIPFAHFGIWASIGSAYFPAVIPLQILLFATGIAAATSPISSLFYLFDKPQYYAIAGALNTIILLIGDYIVIPRYGLIGAGMVRVVVRITLLLFTILYAKRAYAEHLQKN